ncbi:aldo/keto reductase [Caminibacter mediatlanticus TB-2]|uniref:Aldo/keto reductase n=1 Tax=Caminibacter mediatlanticus TB-2 TaxID=391592 RepID=A0ABX5VB06_9BACT|nr:aldo/keto reductase [Caminibacter mediatlanticus]QCT94647.1 aldo/keto reductase [Caminibacter mediatlanticus TB-2]
MEYRYIGKSGLRVTPICIGTMTFGSTTDKKEAFKILDKAYDRGINFYDTAELYPVPPDSKYAGLTEEIVGEWLQTKPRESIILASKVAGAASGWFVPPIRYGLTAIDRFHIKRAIEGSLKRLKTDYIDLYQMHWPDTIVPIEESMRAFNELVKEGKVRYIGTSNDTCYGLTKANMIAKYENLARFESIQNNFSLLNPRALDELAEVCKKESVSLLPYSPLAGGILSGKYLKEMPKDARFSLYLNHPNKRVREHAKKFYNEKTLKATAEFIEIAKKYSVSPVTLALSYSKHFDFVASTITGARKLDQLDEILDALEFKLTNEMLKDIKKLQEKYPYPMG